MSLFRYGLDYVQMAIQRLIGLGKKKSLRKFWQFKKAEPDRIRVLAKFVVYRGLAHKLFKRRCTAFFITKIT